MSMPVKVALLLFVSGFCALVYQVTWFRFLRLIFGASTAANGAVLGIFMGGLGLGAWWWGKRVDGVVSPLRLYAWLELGVSACAAISPFLILLIQWLYVSAGGTLALGELTGTTVRLLLSALVLGVPTFLMGGTLPAVVCAVEQYDQSDTSRRRLGLIYGTNTLGAVCGAFVTTFVAVEVFGVRNTLWMSCLLNGLLVVAALKLARQLSEEPAKEADGTNAATASKEDADEPGKTRQAPVWLVLTAAGLVGFAFFVMELVWYRMLAPILGGSSYTFGLILSCALLGVGMGGLLYSFRKGSQRPTLLAFAATCAIEALLMVIPFVWGDSYALMAINLRASWAGTFNGLVVSWWLCALPVVLPAAIVAGYQFPLLVALLGAGRENVGREVGLAYGSNTLGAIIGSLVGGFGLLPLLTATGVWRCVVWLLAGLALLAIVIAWRLASRPIGQTVVLIALCGVVLAMGSRVGPTAFWRHSPIGAGQMAPKRGLTPNKLKNLMRNKRRVMYWQQDGLESSIALQNSNGLAFYINGKSDGHVIQDAPTQVMAGLIGAMRHPNPKRVLVIGLGTGSTAGWLAALPSVKRVDVFELEPFIKEVGHRCADVNRNVMKNPKVKIYTGDARELLLTMRGQYDLIFSEPSNPFRAGISSLFTREFYRATLKRLKPNGLFIQWLQMYGVNSQTVYTVYATLLERFKNVETWESLMGADLLLLASRRPLPHDIKALKPRLAGQTMREAMRAAWGTKGVKGFYTGFLGNHTFAQKMAARAKGLINTDNDPIIEFEFARTVGKSETGIPLKKLRFWAWQWKLNRPHQGGLGLDWSKIQEMRATRSIAEGSPIQLMPGASADAQRRRYARAAFTRLRFDRALKLWQLGKDIPLGPADKLMEAQLLMHKQSPQALSKIQHLRSIYPVDARVLEALWYHIQGQRKGKDTRLKAVALLESAFVLARKNPWFHRPIMSQGMYLAVSLVKAYPSKAKRLFVALAKPFSVYLLQEDRLSTRLKMLPLLGEKKHCLDVLRDFEPHTPWTKAFLSLRVRCYTHHKHPKQRSATSDLTAYQKAAK